MFSDQLYKDENGKTTLKTSYCLFMDILGFSDEMKNAYTEGRGEQHFDEFSEFYTDVIQKMEGERHGIFSDYDEETSDRSNGYSQWIQKVFTDNIVIGVPMRSGKTEIEFGFILMTIMRFQLHFALNGYFVRGGLDFGDLAMDDNLVFGLPLLESHRLECSVAKFPRIVLSKTVNTLLEKHIRYYSKYFPTGAPQYDEILISEGERFVNYMEDLVVDTGDVTLVDWDNLDIHKQLIEKRLSKFATNARVLPKYQWLASYHNAFCNAISHHPEYSGDYEIDTQATYAITGLDGKPWGRVIRLTY